jgi:hypothetical protein
MGRLHELVAAAKRFAVLAVTAPLAFALVGAGAPEAVSGQWTATPARSGQALHLVLRAPDRAGSVRSTELDAAISALSPVPDLGSAGPLHFVLAREAGSFEFTGTAANRTGAGTFAFTPDAAFADGLRQKGIAAEGGLDVLEAAAADVTAAYVDGVVLNGFPGISLHRLSAFRALGISPAWLGDERRAFGTSISPDDVTALWGLGVGPDYVQRVRSLGVAPLAPRDAIELKAVGVTAEFIDELRSRGLRNPTVAQLIALRTQPRSQTQGVGVGVGLSL